MLLHLSTNEKRIPNEQQSREQDYYMDEYYIDKETTDIFSLPIDIFPFSVRTQNILQSNRILYIGDLAVKTELELSDMGGNKKTFDEVNSTIKRLRGI